MIKSAKVSLMSVLAFNSAVSEAKDYSNRFTAGIQCMDDFYKLLGSKIRDVSDSVETMQTTQNRLVQKIKALEEKIAELTRRINELKRELDGLQDDLDATPKTITVAYNDKHEITAPNPAYFAIEAQIISVKAEISAKQNELRNCTERLEKAKQIKGRLNSQISESISTSESLKEKQSNCKRIRGELDEIRSANSQKGEIASLTLKKVRQVIKDYMAVKIKYDGLNDSNTPRGMTKGLNVSINIDQSNHYHVHGENLDDQHQAINGLSTEEIEKHGIKFDSQGRICLYDNKVFGGKYNSYEERLKKARIEKDPMAGYFEGERGESKYIPSDRTAEGIAVIEILKQFGLDGIEYRNAEPDFEVCSEAVVKISNMTENRENYSDSEGIQQLGNFIQADIECAMLWNQQKRDGRTDWNGRDVKIYRDLHRLTWHEKCDTETMVLVRQEINSYFSHSGGCSECAMRDRGELWRAS